MLRTCANDERRAAFEIQTGVVGQLDHQCHVFGDAEEVMLGAAARSRVDDQARSGHLWHSFQQFGKAGHAIVSRVHINDKDTTQGDAVASLELAHLHHGI